MKTPFTPLPLLLLSAGLVAQSYTFTVAQRAYTEFTEGLPVSDGEIWDDPNYRVPLGFTFNLFGTPLDTLYFNAEEGLGGDLTTEFTDEDGEYLDGVHHLLYAYVSDLADRGTADQEASLSPITYHLQGTAPDRIGVLQWKNAGFFDEIAEDNVADYFIDFQLWLYEGSGRMEVHYGPSSPEVQAGAEGTQPGVALVKNFTFPEGEGPSYDEGYFLRGPAAAPEFVPLTALGEDDFPLVDAAPVPGTVYVFTPAETSATPAPAALAGAFRAFPNPVVGVLHLAADPALGERINRLEVFDAAGRRLAAYAGLPAEVDLAEYRAGVYHLRLTTDSGSTAHHRLVKR